MKFKNIIESTDDSLPKRLFELERKLSGAYKLSDDGRIKKFEESLDNQKDISSDLRILRKMCKEFDSTISELSAYEKFSSVWEKNYKKVLDEYTHALDVYTLNNNSIQDLKLIIKRGDSQDTVLKRLSKFSEVTKYYDFESETTVNFFRKYSVKELESLLRDDKRFGDNISVTLRGYWNLQVHFNNGKLQTFYIMEDSLDY